MTGKMQNIKIKPFIFLLLFLFLTVQVFAQNSVPWWLSLEYGKQRFRIGDFGGALRLFEDARRDRRAMYEQMERDLINFLVIPEVRRIGDNLDRVEQYAAERRYTSAVAALDELYFRIPRSSFNNSAEAALAAFERLKVYTEAEYWIGEIFRIEGELPLALAQYRRAYEMRYALEDPGFSVTLQYKIADILRIRQEYFDFERIMLSIITEFDTLWINSASGETARLNTQTAVPYDLASASFARSGMTRMLEEDGINRFLEMFRYNNTAVEPAHRTLGFYFAISGRPSAEQHLMFDFLIQNTVIIDEIRSRRFDFSFTNLAALMEEVNRNQLLLSYIDEVEYFRTAYYLAASLYRNGKTLAARGIWEFLAGQPRAGEWQTRAASQYRSPRPETLVEMP